MPAMTRGARGREVARFCLVGALCYGLSLGMLIGLHEWVGLHYLSAFAVSFVAANVAGFLLNGHYTFAAGALANRPALLRYILVNGAMLAFNSAALAVLVEHVHMWYVLATVILAALNVPFTYLAHRSVSYRLGSGTRPSMSGTHPH